MKKGTLFLLIILLLITILFIKIESNKEKITKDIRGNENKTTDLIKPTPLEDK